MPTYEYECTACHHRFERRQKITEEPIRTCPNCNGLTRRVLHPVGIIFKGSGWYITDSRSSSDGASIPAPNGSKAEAKNGAGEPKSDAASGTKAEAKNGTAARSGEPAEKK